jgi:hypothetical protein
VVDLKNHLNMARIITLKDLNKIGYISGEKYGKKT